MTEDERLDALRRSADTLTNKIALWVEGLDPEAAGTQTVRHLCATLKDLRDLCRDLDGPRERSFSVTIEGGEETWND